MSCAEPLPPAACLLAAGLQVLGPKGLMPSPKAGTVIAGDAGEAVGQSACVRVADRYGGKSCRVGGVFVL